jgi:hypothetical protein
LREFAIGAIEPSNSSAAGAQRASGLLERAFAMHMKVCTECADVPFKRQGITDEKRAAGMGIVCKAGDHYPDLLDNIVESGAYRIEFLTRKILQGTYSSARLPTWLKGKTGDIEERAAEADFLFIGAT